MTTNYLFIKNMQNDESIEIVKRVIEKLAFRLVHANSGEVQIGWNFLTHEDIKKIKEKLIEKGFELMSVCQTSWKSIAQGVDVL